MAMRGDIGGSSRTTHRVGTASSSWGSWGRRLVPCRKVETTVQGIALVAILAEEEGLDLQSPESIWLNNLKNASRAFLAVLEGDADYLSEAEQRNVMANILDDFEAGAVACTPTTA